MGRRRRLPRPGRRDLLVLVELEMRRADPANNTVKLLRSLETGGLDEDDTVVVCQAFSAYYDLATGGVSTKRENAAFVGRLAADAFDRVTFHAVEFPVEPPKRGASWPDAWPDALATTVDAVIEATP
ncbi:hypothetical protein [Haloarchaeobius iranensis]|uniref:hypothetical protein n=1 Tax=Haloarchaeobius iranensis TaxID=996166 RepID=UPI0011133CE2|nr:hypothetical protein [Haloarchaeobius iranensis]